MKKQEIINKTIEFVKNEMTKNDAGHDWWHIYRVWNLSKNIGNTENVDMFIVELGALLHDIADHKFNNGDESIGPKKAREFLGNLGVDRNITRHVVKIIENISFSKSLDGKRDFDSLELQVIQDADMLDAIGAIGIARNFSYGGYNAREMYNPEIKPKLNMTKEEYKNDKGSTINHFYEKSLLLKDRMNTKTGKNMAIHRHKYMEGFLQEFLIEWEGEK